MRGKRVLVCTCDATMPLDAGALTRACQAAGAEGKVELNSQLCRAQLGNFQRAILGSQPVAVACTQEAPLFREIAAEDNPAAEIDFLNIRETAGWSDDAKAATPKIAALIAAAMVEAEPTPMVALASQGVCLVYGRDEQALEAARQLAGRLDVTVLLSQPGEIIPPQVMDVPVFKGTIVQAKGHLGGFGITVNDYAPATPSGRGALTFDAAKNNAFSECDLILDLTGGTPLFQAAEKRDGYFRPDPGDPAAVQRALFELVDLVGEFDKPRYVKYNAEICAHARSRKTGCTRCLDVCPTGAISPAGDVVNIDPQVCAGCGSCASVCPTGAATYQLPAGDSLFQRLRELLGAYRMAGGKRATLLLHDGKHGSEMIGYMARLGRGLPAYVLPFPLNEVTQVGIDFLAAAFAYGAEQVVILADPKKRDEMSGLAGQIGLAETVLSGLGYGGGRLHVIDDLDPDAVETQLYGLAAPKTAIAPASFLPVGGKRSRAFLALRHLHEKAPEPVDHLPLAPGAPFGRVKVDTEGCTLCLACVSACPAGALLDDENRPWLGFKEDACVQCGLCRVTCPEQVITLEPRLNFTNAAMSAVTLNEDEPFECIRCGKPFGVRKSIERISEQLAGKHSMFRESGQIDRIKMCEDCRISHQFESTDNPFQRGTRPTIRTTDDDLRERDLELELARAKANGGPGGKPGPHEH
ncbi:4Fe-4S binding protein [Pelagibius sp. 7325]|uniref:4Fe-4S dicluster domain-containing protein n=1 Tax=Pelagibius sp. 7325 TaxID=3131994 RepID=UPI0030EEE938